MTSFWIVFCKDILQNVNAALFHIVKSYVTPEHKTSFKSLGYICSNSQKTHGVKIIDFHFMPNIIRTLSKDHVS